MKESVSEKKSSISVVAIVLMIVFTAGIIAASFLTGSITFNNFKNAYLGGNQEVKAPTIKVGIYECLSGEYKQYGKDEAAGIELAHDLYPQVLGKEIELIYADNRSNMYDAETALQELMSQNPNFVFGSYGDVLTLVGSDYFTAANTPAITITSINPLITANNDFYFTASFSVAKQGIALADYIVTGLGKESFATVKALRDDSSRAIVRRFRNRIKSLMGREDVFKADITVDAEATDFRGQIEQLKELNPDAVLLSLPPAAAQLFMTQSMELGFLPQFLGIREWDNPDFEEFLTNNPDLSVSYPSVQAADNTARYNQFITAYYNKYGQNAAEPSGAMAAAFDAYLIMLKGMQDAYDNVMNTDMEELKASAGNDAKGRAMIQTYETARETGIPAGVHIRDAIKEISDFEGATGILSYDGSTEVSKSVTILHFFMGEKLAPYVVDDDKTVPDEEMDEETPDFMDDEEEETDQDDGQESGSSEEKDD